MEQKKTVLIVEDEKNIVDIIRFNLQRTGYDTLEAYDGEAGLAMAREKKPDLILLDVMMPKMMGFDVCRALREEGDNVPVIILTAREEEEDKILGLEIGADDYITKPFSMRELLARVKANIRRTAMLSAPAAEDNAMSAGGGITINTDSFQVRKNGVPIDLTQREYELLTFLASHPGKVFSRVDLMEQVWNYGYVGDDGSYTGFDLELAQETAKRNDWEVQLEPIDWDAKDTLMDSGAINCIWNGFTIEGRENDYSFSGNYMINAQVIVVKKDSGITDFAGLAGKAVITQTDSAAYEVLAGEDADKADVAATFASLETIGDYNTAFMQLESGAVDAVACDLSIAAYQLAAKPDAYAQLDEKLSEEHYAVGFKKGDDATAATVTETLKAMDADGFVKDLCDKYADQGISYENWCLA